MSTVTTTLITGNSGCMGLEMARSRAVSSPVS
jgi:hypothetical protein